MTPSTPHLPPAPRPERRRAAGFLRSRRSLAPRGTFWRRRPRPGVLAAWVVWQGAVLASAAWGWRWTHGWPGPAGEGAVELLLAAQVLASAVLGTDLVRGVPGWLLATSAGVAASAAAAAVADRPPAEAAVCAAWLAIWLASFLSWPTRTRLGLLTASARGLATLLVAVEVIFAYRGDRQWLPAAVIGLANHPHFPPPEVFLLPVAVFAAGVTATVARKIFRRDRA